MSSTASRSTGAIIARVYEVVVVDLDQQDPPAFQPGVADVVVGITARDLKDAPCDVVLAPDDARLESILDTVRKTPIAAIAFAQLLRGSQERTVDDGLVAESALYSALQAGPEFRAWRDSRPITPRPDDGDAVALRREGDALHITLTRPHVRNALNTKMRDQLCDAFDVAIADESIAEVHLWGDGDGFCAGGDLDEFGSFPDPATAHVVRLQQSVGRRIAAVAARVTAHLHGACLGSGVELPAVAANVTARPATTFGLPEVALGLIPGAGGTVSLPRRIGRHRTALLGLTGERIDVATAVEWGLVDSVDGS